MITQSDIDHLDREIREEEEWLRIFGKPRGCTTSAEKRKEVKAMRKQSLKYEFQLLKQADNGNK